MRRQSRLAAVRAASWRSDSTSNDPQDHPADAIMIEHDLLHGARGERDRRAGLRVVPPVQLPRVTQVLGVHLLRALLHRAALPVARPRRPVACRARVHRACL